MTSDSMTTSTEHPLTILFVCSGNTCRSPMAEIIARKVAAEAGLQGVTFQSAGSSTLPGLPASQGARTTAGRHGLTLEGHLSEPLSQELIARSGLILTMGLSHLMRVVELGGEGKTALLGAFAGGEGADAHEPTVPDPYGGDDEVYEDTFQVLEGYVKGALARLAAERGVV